MITKNAVLEFVKAKLGEEVRLAKEIPINRPGMSLTVWLERGPMPPKKVSVLQTEECVFACDASFSAFQRALKIIRPDLGDIAYIARLVRETGPPQRSIVENEESFGWLREHKDIWHPPMMLDGNLAFICNDLREGRWEKFVLSAAYDLTVEDVGRGKKVGRR